MTSAWRTIESRARRGFEGNPIATVGLYGPDDRVATKVAVGIVDDDGEVRDLERWRTHGGDVRDDDAIGVAVLAFVHKSGARTIVMVQQIIGCPHEEGIDYPLGTSCPQCPFWEGRDRWAGLPVDDAETWWPTPGKTRPTYVTDLRHFLDDEGDLPDLPGPALSLALHQIAIVEWMTMVLPMEAEATNVYCRRRPNRRRCRGQILARFRPQRDAIEWSCPACGDHGIIYGWTGTRWDRSEFLADDDEPPY